MKKKIVSLIMVLCLTAALFCGLSISAFADGEDTVAGYWIPYTVENGDTLYNICAGKGIDFNAQGSRICAFSGISNVKGLRAGMTVWLPVSDKGSSDTYYTVYSHEVVAGDTWYNLCLGYKTTYNACSAKIEVLNGKAGLMAGAKVLLPVLTQPAAAPSGSASSSSTAAFPASSSASAEKKADTDKKDAKPAAVSSSYKYLVPVVLAKGDTVGALCKGMGTDFNTYSAVISTINGVSNFNSLRVGQKLLLPSNTAPASGDYYKISEHTVAAGDSLKDICKGLNVDVNASLDLIKKLNPGLKNPGLIYAGQKLLIPVSVNAATAVPEADAPAASSAASTAQETVKKSTGFSSIMIFATENGDVISKVGGSHKTVASEGTKVTLDITPNDGYKVGKITVNTYSSKKSVKVDGTSFEMPGEAVEVSVTFVKG